MADKNVVRETNVSRSAILKAQQEGAIADDKIRQFFNNSGAGAVNQNNS